MHALLLGALAGHARAGDFRQAVNIVGLDGQGLFNLPAHFLGPGLGAKDADAHPQALRVDALVPHRLADVHGVAGGAAQNVRAVVLENLHLAVCVAGGHGNHRGAQLLGAVVEAQAAGEQAVAIADVDEVLVGAAAAHNGAGGAAGPDVQVVLGVGHHGLLACGAGGGVDPGQVVPGHGDKPEGIGVPQILLGGKGELLQVVDGLDVLGTQPYLVKFFLVEGHVLVAVLDHLHQPLGLDLAQRLPGGAFDFRLEIIWHGSSILSLWWVCRVSPEHASKSLGVPA